MENEKNKEGPPSSFQTPEQGREMDAKAIVTIKN
jgi:hypothetical protein